MLFMPHDMPPLFWQSFPKIISPFLQGSILRVLLVLPESIDYFPKLRIF